MSQSKIDTIIKVQELTKALAIMKAYLRECHNKDRAVNHVFYELKEAEKLLNN